MEYSYICSIENSPYPNYETTYGNPPVHACIRRRNSRRRVGRPGRPARQHPAPPARPGHLLLLQDPAGCIGGRPRPITDDAARRCLEIPFCGRRRPKPRRVLATGRRPRRLGRDRSSLVLGDAGLRVSDIHQHPLSVRVQAAVDHTRQPDGMLRPKIHRTPKLGRRPGGAALRGRILGLLRLGQRHPGRICRGQLPALGIRRHRPAATGREHARREGFQMDGRQLPRRCRPLAHGGHTPRSIPCRKTRCGHRRLRGADAARRRHARRAVADTPHDRPARGHPGGRMASAGATLCPRRDAQRP